MKQELIPINARLWHDFVAMAQQEGEQPVKVIARLVREYMAIRRDIAQFEKMRTSVRGREMTEKEAVEFVHQYRREKQLARNAAASRVPARRRRNSKHLRSAA
jgi:hypothetical protein